MSKKITGADLLKSLNKVGETSSTDKEEKEEEKKKITGADILEGAKRISTYASTDTSSVNEEYFNTFITDASNFLKGAEETYKGINWGNASSVYDSTNATWQDLNKRKNTIEAWLYQNKSRLGEDAYKSYSDTLNSINTNASDVLNIFDSAKSYYSEFKTEDDYNAAVEYQKKEEEKHTFDLEAGKLELEELEATVNAQVSEKRAIEQEINRLKGQRQNYYSQRNIAKADECSRQIAALEEKLKPYEDVAAQLAEKRAYYRGAELVQKIDKIQNDATSALDFEQYAQIGEAIENPTYLDMVKGNMYKDTKPNNIATFARDTAEYGRHIDPGELTMPGNEYYKYKFLTKDEVSVYNYYLGKGDTETAEAYLTSLDETLTARYSGQLADNYDDSGLLKAVFAVGAGLDQFATGMGNLFSNEDYYAPTAVQMASQQIRETIDSGIGKVGYDLLNTTGNMLPSILIGTIPGIGQVAGAASMGLSAAGNAKAEMINLGYSKEQANAYGLLVGASEAGLQYLLGGITKLGGGKLSQGLTSKILTKVDNAFARTAIKLGGSMASEALEESLQTVLEPWFKHITTGADFEAANIDEVLYSGLLGALSAGLLEGGGTILGEYSTYETGQKVQNVGAVARLKELGTTFAADTVAHQLAEKVNENSGAYDIGRLFYEVGATLTETNKADIAKDLENKGVPSVFSNTLAKWIDKVVEGESLNPIQKAVLNSNEVLSKTMMDVLINPNTTVYQRTQAYSEALRLMESGGSTAMADVGRVLEPESMPQEAKSVPEVKEDSQASVSPTEAETPTTAEILSHYDGKTRLIEDNSEVNVQEIDSIKDGVVSLRLDDGRVVDKNDVYFGNKDEGLVYEAVATMDVDADVANTIVEGFNSEGNVSVEDYVSGVRSAYNFGYTGFSVNELSISDKTKSLPEQVSKAAFNKGKINATVASQKTQNAMKETVSKVKEAKKSVKESKKEGSTEKTGRVTLHEIDESTLTKKQSVQVKALERIAKVFSKSEFTMFASYVNEEGKRVYKDADGKIKKAPSGKFYADGRIWIDINAGYRGNSLILFTAAHELTHFAKEFNPEQYNLFTDFLMEQYGNLTYNGRKVSVDMLVERQIEKAKNNNREISYDEAFDEVVADSCERFLVDGNALTKLDTLEKKDKGLVAKIKKFISNLVKEIKRWYAGVNPDSLEANLISRIDSEAYNKLISIWEDMVSGAGVNYQVLDGSIDLDGDENIHFSDKSMIEGAGLQFVANDNGVYKVLDKNGKPVKSVTPEMMINSPLGNLVTMAKNNGYLGTGKEASIAANKQYKFLADLVNMCIKYEGLAPVWEVAGTMVFSSVKSNADKQYGLTVDFSTVCKKTQAIVDAMSGAMLRLNRGLTRSEVETIYLEVGKAGESTPCPVCYVFSRWMGIGGILDQMNRFQNKYSVMSEKKLQAFIDNIYGQIKAQANAKGSTEGKALSDLKAKANSKAASALKAISNNANTKLQIQELEALMENQDAKGAKKTAKKIDKQKAKLVDDASLEQQLKEANDTLEEYEAYQWVTRVLMMESDGKWVKNPAFKAVPSEVLFDLNKGDVFAENYPLSWAFRTGKGASAGKAIVPYSDARVGEAIQAVAYNDVKQIDIGLELNPFLNGDTKKRNEILKRAIEKQARQNLVGGMRYQSTSDFRYEYGSDYLITFLEMQAIGAKVQLYTKVIEAVDFLASMGADCNLSVMPLSDGFIILEDGTKKLIYSSVTGINAEAAIAKAHEYNNVQLILVGISDEHIRLALSGMDVTFVIPFHGSGNSVHQIQALMNLLGENLDVTTAQDYTPVQSDHVSPKQTKEQKAMWDLRVKIIQGKASKLTANELALLDKNTYLKDLYRRFYIDKNADEYGVALVKGQAEQIFPYEYWDKSLTYAEADKNGDRFQEYCASMGIIPRFSGMDSKGESVGFGDFTKDKGYWKLLIDRPMYDNTYDADGNWTGYGKYHVQQRINCSNFKVEHLDPEYGSATYGDVMSKANDPKKTNKIVDAALAQFGKEEKFSDRDNSWRNVDKIQGLEDYTVEEVNDIVRQHIENLAMDFGEEISIIDIRPYGSRARGTAKNTSDLDFVVQYEGDIREDDMFNMLNDEDKLVIDGIEVDINPIKADDTGTIEEYLDRVYGYDKYSETKYSDRGTSELTYEDVAAQEGIKYSDRVTDKKTLDFLNKQIENGEYITVYRSFQVIDGGLYAPMNAVDRDGNGKNKKLGYRSEYGQWEMATESPEIAQRYMDKHPDAKHAKFDLDGVDNKTSGVAYNPYLHASNLVLNDQFAAAYRRNLITVECRVPLSEVGAYKAKYAKDTTGWVEWKPGGVAGKLMKVKPEYTRRLFVSRYMLPVRKLSEAEVAQMYKEYLEGTDIKVPWNVVTPELRKELVKAGVQISYKDVKKSNGEVTKFSDVFEEKYSDREVVDISSNDYRKMYDHFGSTTNYDVAGYMLQNGVMLDFSGKHWGDDYSTSRQVDHRDIQEVLEDRGNNGVNAMIDMISNGNIRLMPETGGINLAVMPNESQIQQLRGYINHFRGEIIIDIDEVGGDTIHSWEYNRGTASAKILADIKTYFEKGTIPQQQSSLSEFRYSDRGYAPTFYSQMGKVIEGMKQEKFGADSVIPMLRGRGVKAEEIKWSGIVTWLENKKSVTKQELLEFIAGSQLQIGEATRSDKELPYTDSQKKRFAELEPKRDSVVNKLSDEWKRIVGVEIPFHNFGAGINSDVEREIREINLEYKSSTFEGRLLKKLREDLKSVIKRNDDFGFDYWGDALVSIHRHRKDFVKKNDMSTADKAVVVKYCNALNAYNEIPNKISDADTDILRGLADEAHSLAVKIHEVKMENYAEIAKHRPNWKKYSLKGGENYRELVFTMPNSNYTNEAMQAHWGVDAQGVLAHARIQDFVVDGKKMLFIEEIQSDWHNEGHNLGYEGSDVTKKYEADREKHVQKTLDKDFGEGGEYYYLKEDYKNLSAKEKEFVDGYADALRKQWEAKHSKQEYEDQLVPEAPFKDTYHEYVLKRLLRMAAEEGYDSIGWTPADVQTQRWSDKYAEGYRIEYDQDMPKFLKKYGRQWGATVEYAYINKKETLDDISFDDIENKSIEELNNGTKVWSMDLTDSMKDSVLHEGQVLYSDRDSTSMSNEERIAGEAFDNFINSVVNMLDQSKVSKRKLKIGAISDTHAKIVESLMKKIDPNFSTKGYELWIDGTSAEHIHKRHGENGKADNSMATKEARELIPWVANHPDTGDFIRNGNGTLQLSNRYFNADGSKAPQIRLEKAVNGETVYVSECVPDSMHKRIYITSAYKKSSTNQLLNIDSKESPQPTPKAVFDSGATNGSISNNPKSVNKNTEISESKHQDRDSGSMSNRSLLANALESTAQNDIEKNKLAQYKEKIDLIESEEKKLHKLNEQIKEILFTRGARDTAKLRSLQFEAKQTANRINTYDRQLLNLEASKPLKAVLEREKKIAYKKAEQKGREAVARQREKDAKTQRELMTRYQESRKKGIERRNMTELRNKIKKVVGELNTLLLRPSKDRHVTEELRSAVAEALSVINMDTVGADERIAKIEAEIARATDPVIIDELTASRDRIKFMGEKLKAKLTDLQTAYEKIKNSEDEISNAYEEAVLARIKAVNEEVGDTPIRYMTLKQLESVYDMYKMVLTTIRNANSVWKNGKIEELRENASAVMEEVAALEQIKGERTVASEDISKFSWQEMTPVYAFERIGSKTFKEFFWEAIEGQNVFARDVAEAKDFADKTREKYGYKKWNLDKVYEFKLKDGKTFSTTLKHLLSIYAYSKREQALDHMKTGGFFYNAKAVFRKKAGLIKFLKTNPEGYCIDEDILAEIKDALTSDQLNYVDEMQEYLTRMGEKGNEVSRVVWGIDIFKEKVYFPLMSKKDFISKSTETAQAVSLKNDGMTKETVPHASNPIVLEAFDDVWANHINRMSQYHAFVIPIDNLNKILHYGTWSGTESMSVSTLIESRHTTAAVDYLEQFIKDLNGGVSSQGATNPLIGFFTKFKKTAVGASLSTVIQQPTAILRALSMIDAKYFVGKPNLQKLSNKWEELKTYAPVAIIKEIGGFDAGIGKQVSSWLNEGALRGGDKVMSIIDNISMKGAEVADQVGWTTIWEAVKREIAATTDLEVGSEAFLKKCGERFTEVVVKTQVYDSTLSRSGFMRSKHDTVKMLTAFMGEPTLSMNMMIDAIIQGKRGGKTEKAQAVRTIAFTYASMIAASVAASLIYALRDDDEDESYLEKYMNVLGGEFISDIVLAPVTSLPAVKDIVSIFQGWDVERSDVAVFKDLKDAFDGLSSENKSTYRKIEDFAGAIGGLFGIPAKNLLRTGREIYNAFRAIFDGIEGGDLGGAFVEGITGKEKKTASKLYEAIISGDQARIEAYMKEYEDEDAIGRVMVAEIKRRYLSKELDYNTAEQYLIEYGGVDEDDVYWKMQEWEYELENGDSDDYGKYNDFFDAVQSGKNLKAVIKEYTDNGVDAKTLASQITSHFKPLYKEMSKSQRAGIKGYLLNAYALLGYDRDKKSKDIDKWVED